MLVDKNQPIKKMKLHPRNRNREKYNLSALVEVVPELTNYIVPNKAGEDSVDFSNPKAIRLLNQAIFHYYYDVKKWKFPVENLCPPIPGRADYIHYIADTLSESNFGKIPVGRNIKILDIGVGASCIYPLIGTTEYKWSFIASDISQQSIDSSKQIAGKNPSIEDKIEFRLQNSPNNIFKGILRQTEKIEAVICNPPFHPSSKEAEKVTRRKVKNLTGNRVNEIDLAGIHDELICDGGEYKFIKNMVKESEKISRKCLWFSSLVSKQSNLKAIQKLLQNTRVKRVKIIPMGTGNKSTRIIAWTYLSKEDQKNWRETRWKK
ncbi:MAG: 23S rRNA (adenine(1618)-N(6))-methyltransferase RlmF [Crocinitomicaceae bacterium]|nr:23S rRNA (adenine(1618)-N(6))-methyltransferase RlmF [Crocinitomicaceae bacterium]